MQVTIREGLDGAVVPDTRIDSGRPTSNYGTDVVLLTGWISGAGALRALLMFDLSVLPARASITAAKLTLRASVASANPASAKVRRITKPDWIEGSATWYTYNGFQAWTSFGGDYTEDDEVDWTLPTATGDFDITGLATLVVDAIANRGAELHVLLMRAAEFLVSGEMEVLSGEYGTLAHQQSQRPRLIVDYTPPAASPAWYYRMLARRRSY